MAQAVGVPPVLETGIACLDPGLRREAIASIWGHESEDDSPLSCCLPKKLTQF